MKPETQYVFDQGEEFDSEDGKNHIEEHPCRLKDESLGIGLRARIFGVGGPPDGSVRMRPAEYLRLIRYGLAQLAQAITADELESLSAYCLSLARGRRPAAQGQQEAA